MNSQRQVSASVDGQDHVATVDLATFPPHSLGLCPDGEEDPLMRSTAAPIGCGRHQCYSAALGPNVSMKLWI